MKATSLVRSLAFLPLLLLAVEACSSSSEDTTPTGTPDASKHHDATASQSGDAMPDFDGTIDESPDAADAADEAADDAADDSSTGDSGDQSEASTDGASDAGAGDGGPPETGPDAGHAANGDAGPDASSGLDAALDAGNPVVDASLPPYASIDDAGIAALCNAECALSVTCANAAGAHVDGGACGPCSFPAAQRKLRADLFATTSACIAKLGASSCGDAGGAVAANACYLNAVSALQPSPATNNFCAGTVLALCPISDCAQLLAPRSDPTIGVAQGCFADAGPGLGNCGPFNACVSGAVN